MKQGFRTRSEILSLVLRTRLKISVFTTNSTFHWSQESIQLISPTSF